MKQDKILIMGLGHLATFMVKELLNIAEIWGTYRSKSSEPAFDNIRKVEYNSLDSIPDELIQDWDVVLWMLPPFKGYKEILREFDSHLTMSCPWIFVSSTSVYGQGDIDENSRKENSSRTGKLLIDIEAMLKRLERNVSIVRPSGLVDSIRHPANFLKNKTIIKGAGTPVNLVHTHDVARFIRFVISKEIHSQDFNLASDSHMSKEDFYSRIMKSNSIRPPSWDYDESLHRIILNHKSKSLGFEYLYPDLMEYFIELASD